MSQSSDERYAALPFLGGIGAWSRGPGSVLDHPGGSLYAPLPQSAASSATYSYASGYDEDDDLPPPPPEWLAPAPVLPAAEHRRPLVTPAHVADHYFTGRFGRGQGRFRRQH